MPDDSLPPPPVLETPPAPEPDAPLGESGQKALDAMKVRVKEAEAKAKEADALREQLAAAQQANESAAEAAIRTAREEAAKATRDELSPELAKARLELAVIRSAGSKLTDPSDALQFIDPTIVTNEDGTVDVDKLAAAIDALIAAKPYLAAGPKPPVQVPGGPRSEVDPQSLPERIAEARAKGDLDTAIALSLQQLPAPLP